MISWLFVYVDMLGFMVIRHPGTNDLNTNTTSYCVYDSYDLTGFVRTLVSVDRESQRSGRVETSSRLSGCH